MTSRYKCTLSDELLRKAAEDLNEPTDNERRLEEIEKLRAKFGDDRDDAFYLKFLRSAKFDVDYAYEIIVNYTEQRKSWPEMFDKVDNPEKLTELLNHGFALPLPCTANDGSFVVMGRAAIAFEHTDDGTDFVAMIILTVETLLKDENFQINGYHVIQDMSGMYLSSILKLASVAKRMVKVLESMPINLKSLNIVNEFGFFDLIYTIARNFMKEHIRKMLAVHGSDYTKLHQLIDKEHLPPSIGGEWNIDEDKIKEWKNKVLSRRSPQF